MAEYSSLRAFAAAVHAEWGGTADYEVGAQHLHTQVGPPYVVWTAASEKHQYGGIDHGPVYNATTGETVKQIITRQLMLDVHIWGVAAGATVASDAAESILEGLIAAAYNVASGSFVTIGASWPKMATHEHSHRGELVIWRCTVDLQAGGWTQDTATIGDPPTTNPTLTFEDEI